MKALWFLLLVVLASCVTTSQAQPTPNFITNGDFETDKDANIWPDDWGKLDHGATYESEEGNHFLRLSYTKPDDTLVLYRSIAIPEGVEALEFSFRARTTGLQVGLQPWFDARIMLNFNDGAGNEVKPSPAHPYLRESSGGWTTRSQKFLVPTGAKTIEIMPALFQVKAGRFDVDDLILSPVEATVLKAEAVKAEELERYLKLEPEAPQPTKWPGELQVHGSQILKEDGQPIRLQGVNIESLEWSAGSENVLRATQVAIDEWKSNLIRLPLNSEFWFGKGATDGGAAYRKLVTNVITLAANHGAYTLLDLHHFGAPRTRDADFWKDAATRFKNNPTVLFDLFNEPHGTTWEVWRDGGFIPDKDAPADEDNFLSPEEKALNAKGFHGVGMQKLIDTVRATGAKNIVVIGGLDWAYDLSGIAGDFALSDNGGHGIVYSTHIYPWKTGWEKAVVPLIGKHPIIVGEVGASHKKMDWLPAEAQEDAATWVPKMLGFIQKHKLHWTGFGFHPTVAPNMISGWDFKPTPEWGEPAKRALAGEEFGDLGVR